MKHSRIYVLSLLVLFVFIACSKQQEQKPVTEAKKAFLEWSDNLSIKIKEIDDQHKTIAGLLNELHDAVMANKDREFQGKILDKLIAETDKHFKTEEKYMTLYAYTGLDENVKLHADFVKTCLDLQSKFKAGTANIDMPVLEMIKKWLAEHISTKDAEMGKFLVSKGMS
jgi:hemerythrin